MIAGQIEEALRNGREAGKAGLEVRFLGGMEQGLEPLLEVGPQPVIGNRGGQRASQHRVWILVEVGMLAPELQRVSISQSREDLARRLNGVRLAYGLRQTS